MFSRAFTSMSILGLSLTGLVVALAGCTSSNSADEGGKGGETSQAGSGNEAGSGNDAGSTSTGAGGLPEGCPEPCDGNAPADCTTVVTPANPLITDWEDVCTTAECSGMFVDSDNWSASPTEWWEGFFGGPFAFPLAEPDLCADPTAVAPEYSLSQSVVDGVLVVEGQVQYFGGFGIWLEKCVVDMSAYAGIQFDISGNVGPSGELKFTVAIDSNATPRDTCRPNLGTCTDGECVQPSTTITVPAEPGTPVTVLWEDFTGGSPSIAVDPSKVYQLQWEFIASTDGEAYDAEVMLDNVTLVAAH